MQFRRTHMIKILLIAFDIISIAISYFAALWVRFDGSFNNIPRIYVDWYLQYLPINLVITILLLYLLGMYQSIWRYASINEVFDALVAVFASGIFHICITVTMHHRMPLSYYFFGWMLLLVLIIGSRIAPRVVRVLIQTRKTNAETTNVMVIGAGEAGRIIIMELIHSTHLHLKPRCVIDDSPVNKGKFLSAVPIVGGREKIPEAVIKYNIQQIIFAIPTASAANRRDILNICKETGCTMRIIPGVYQLLNGEVSLAKLRPVSINDLLGREPIRVNNTEIGGYISGKIVMVTGGGGSIGAELCRQIAAHRPKQLIILDIYENNAYEIQQELLLEHPELNLTVLIGSVRDRKRVDTIFDKYRPEIIYHAAAHKHVPLMEDSPNEAIKNNILGTWNTAKAAAEYKASRFVLISTDKAVNPTSLMGATKRICEMIIQTMAAEKTGCEFVAVRFGNVLGSNGSVVPLFQKQIADGGPVTVTHPDIVRFFMTIPEAVALVIQAGAYAKGGEIFVLDMGEPVKIVDLARNLIKLSGYVPDEDIKIVYTGLRPGEKLYEEKLMDEEGLQKTPNNLIFIGKPRDFDVNILKKRIWELIVYAYSEADDTKERVRKIIEDSKTSELEKPQA